VAEIRSGTHTARQESARHLYQPTCTVSHTAALISARFFCRCTPRIILLDRASYPHGVEASRRVRSRRRDRWSAPIELTQRQAAAATRTAFAFHVRRASTGCGCRRRVGKKRGRKETTGNSLARRGRAHAWRRAPARARQAFLRLRDARRHQPQRSAHRTPHARGGWRRAPARPQKRRLRKQGQRQQQGLVPRPATGRIDPWPGGERARDIPLRYLTSEDGIGASDVAGIDVCVLCVRGMVPLRVPRRVFLGPVARSVDAQVNC
jgi:hypothetical protein